MWCSQPFFIRPEMTQRGAFPESARVQVLETLLHAEKFSFSKWLHHLSHPTKLRKPAREVSFQRLSEDRFTATIPYQRQWEFQQDGSQWHVIRESPVWSIHPPAPPP
jgi:hypothetical protein